MGQVRQVPAATAAVNAVAAGGEQAPARPPEVSNEAVKAEVPQVEEDPGFLLRPDVNPVTGEAAAVGNVDGSDLRLTAGGGSLSQEQAQMSLQGDLKEVRKASQEVSYQGGEFSLAFGDSQRVDRGTWDEKGEGEGTLVSEERSRVTLAGAGEGFVVGGDGTRTVAEGDGTKVKSAQVNANLLEGQINGGVGRTIKDAEGNTVKGAQVRAGLDVGANGIQNANAQGTLTRGKASLTVRGNAKYLVSPPVRTPAGFQVTLERQAGKGAGVGLGLTAESDHTRGSVEVKHFTTLAEAEAWRKGGRTIAEGGPTGREAAAMKPGDKFVESVRDTEAAGLSLGSVVQAGAKGATEVSEQRAFEMGTDGALMVTVDRSRGTGDEATLGSHGGSLGLSRAEKKTEQQKLKFDLRTPAGKAAYDLYQATGVVSEVGVTVVARAQSDERGNGMKGSLAGLAVNQGSRVVNGEAVHADGSRQRSVMGENTLGAAAPLLGNYSEKVALTQLQNTDSQGQKSKAYPITAEVEGSDGTDIGRTLARLSNTTFDPGQDVKASGKWNVTSAFSEAQMQALVAAVQKGDLHNAHGGVDDFGEVRKLKAALRGVRDPEVIRQALAAFVAETGTGGLQNLRDAAGGTQRTEVALQGDPYMNGAAGWAAIDAARQKVQAAQGADAPTMDKAVNEAVTTLGFLRRKRVQLEDASNYPELPPALRAQEIARTEAAIRDMEAATEALEPARAAEAEAGRPTDPGADQSFSDPAAAISPVAGAAGVSDVDSRSGLIGSVAQGVATSFAGLGPNRSRAQEQAARAQISHRVQVGGAYSRRPAAEALDGFAHEYQQAEKSFAGGQRAWVEAQKAEQDARQAWTEIRVAMASRPDALHEIPTRVFAPIQRAKEMYDIAAQSFQIAEASYQEIRSKAGNSPKLFGGYDAVADE